MPNIASMADDPQIPRLSYKFEDQLRLLHEGKFADFDIKCGEHTFKVHRFVICSQSPFFKALAGGDFKEASEQATELPDEDAALLVRYLIYLYSDSYPEKNVATLQAGTQFLAVQDEHAVTDKSTSACFLHARMYCFARRRCDARLEKFALQEFSRNYWKKRPRQDTDKHNLVPRGATRAIKYHLGRYVRDAEETLLVGTKNTRGEIFNLMSDFADWSDIAITQRRVRNPDAVVPPYRSRAYRDDIWADSNVSLMDFDFDNMHLVVIRTPNSNSKNLSLLSCINRWQTKTLSKDEQEMTRFILTETIEYGIALKEMLSLDLTMRKNSGHLVPDPDYRALQLEYPEFFLALDSLVRPNESRQCTTCFSIQPVLRQPCSCGNWSDNCEKDCLSKQLDELRCYCCMNTGTMEALEDRSVIGSRRGSTRGIGGGPPPPPGPYVFVDDDLSDY